VKIGRQTDPNTSISASNAETIVVRGFDLSAELIGHLSLTEHFFLLLTGERPTDIQRRMLDATLVSIAEHGLVPSVQAARMTYAAAPEALQGAVAAGILGCGSVILGSSETAGRFLAEIVAARASNGNDLDAAALDVVKAYRAARRPVPGYGHPLHKARDPRVERLLAYAQELGCAGAHIAAAEAAEKAVHEVLGKPLMMNVSGAIPATLLDAGFPIAALKGVPLLARTASLIAHLVEEQRRSIGFVLSEHAETAIGYDGVKPPGFEPSAH
jgi:citrate synthase